LGKWNDHSLITEEFGSIETNPYQQGWFVPHDFKGLISLLDGCESVLKLLNDLFEKAPENMLWNQYYNHANEPVYHVAYFFNRIQAPWLT
jgi:putative alpha-1,2-mannosidase